MSLETSHPLHHDDEQLPPARRRRQRRSLQPQGANSRIEYFQALNRQATPSLEFFALAMLAAVMSGIALITDAPAFYILAALMAPFLAPMVGLSFATLLGSLRFFGQSLAAMALGLVFVFGGGLAAGFFARGEDPASYVLAHHLAYVSVADLLLLSFGMVATMVLLTRRPEQTPRLASAALAFELLIPAAVAGFGLSSGIEGMFQSALVTVLIHLAWGTLLGTITLAILGLRPNTMLGYTMSGILILVSLGAAVVINGSVQLPQMPHLEAAVLPTVRPTVQITRTPQPSNTPTITQTPTITKTQAPSATFTTAPATATDTPEPSATPTLAPTPEPVLAIIDAKEGNGAVFRSAPYLSAEAVVDYPTLLNGTYVKMYEVVENTDGQWARVRLLSNDAVEGWVLRSLLNAERSN
ncbi:MAG: SH3-like domain-containing protein [Anaerolineae bacterium]|nr:SH3-like domain-containing protein [Anaerolineae bacterium]